MDQSMLHFIYLLITGHLMQAYVYKYVRII